MGPNWCNRTGGRESGHRHQPGEFRLGQKVQKLKNLKKGNSRENAFLEPRGRSREEILAELLRGGVEPNPGPTPSEEVCRDFLFRTCVRENCRFSHVRPPCRDFAAGHCEYGKRCRFSHEQRKPQQKQSTQQKQRTQQKQSTTEATQRQNAQKQRQQQPSSTTQQQNAAQSWASRVRGEAREAEPSQDNLYAKALPGIAALWAEEDCAHMALVKAFVVEAPLVGRNVCPFCGFSAPFRLAHHMAAHFVEGQKTLSRQAADHAEQIAAEEVAAWAALPWDTLAAPKAKKAKEKKRTQRHQGQTLEEEAPLTPLRTPLKRPRGAFDTPAPFRSHTPHQRKEYRRTPAYSRRMGSPTPPPWNRTPGTNVGEPRVTEHRLPPAEPQLERELFEPTHAHHTPAPALSQTTFDENPPPPHGAAALSQTSGDIHPHPGPTEWEAQVADEAATEEEQPAGVQRCGLCETAQTIMEWNPLFPQGHETPQQVEEIEAAILRYENCPCRNGGAAYMRDPPVLTGSAALALRAGDVEQNPGPPTTTRGRVVTDTVRHDYDDITAPNPQTQFDEPEGVELPFAESEGDAEKFSEAAAFLCTQAASLPPIPIEEGTLHDYISTFVRGDCLAIGWRDVGPNGLEKQQVAIAKVTRRQGAHIRVRALNATETEVEWLPPDPAAHMTNLLVSVSFWPPLAAPQPQAQETQATQHTPTTPARAAQQRETTSGPSTGQVRQQQRRDEPERPPATFRRLRPRAVPKFLATLRATIGRYSVANDSVEKAKIWSDFLAFPRLHLLKTGGGNKQRATRHNDATVQIAEGLAKDGFHKKAVDTLLRDSKPADKTQHVVNQLRALHPQAALPPPPPTDETAGVIDVDGATAKFVLKKLCRGKAPGPSGWTEELLAAALADSYCEEALVTMLSDILNGEVPVASRNALATSRLIALPKPDGKIRPVAIGEAVVKWAGAVAVSLVRKRLLERFGAFQRGAAPRGAEEIVHEFRAAARADFQTHILTIDCRNAFNAFSRTKAASELYGDKMLAPLWGFFKTFYCEASSLDFLGVKIPSTNGARQGDPPSGPLFCLTEQPCLEEVASKFPSLILRAFMDDISVAGAAADIKAVFPELKRLLGTLGLEINMAKTLLYSPNSASAKDLAAELGITWAENGLRILGAFVSADPAATAAFLEAKLLHYKPFFAKVQLLSPQFAFPLLQSCAASRWMFLARTHPPEEAMAQHKKFDELTLDAFAAVVDIDRRDLSEKNLAALHLPMRDGGAGLTQISRIAAAAFEASKDPTTDSQEVRTQKLTEEMVKQLSADKGWELHLRACARRNASAWIRAGALIRADPFRESILNRIRFVKPNSVTQVRCNGCGATFPPEALAPHILGCTKVKGTGPTTRHARVVTALQNACRLNAVPVSIERALDEKGELRMDLVIEFDDGVSYVDVTLPSATSKGHASKTEAVLEQQVRAHKTKKYADAAKRDGARLEVFQIDALGGWSNAALDIAKRIAEPGPMTREEIVVEVAAAVANTNGDMLRKAWSRVPPRRATAATPAQQPAAAQQRT